MTEYCQNCDSPVTNQFARVFGDQDDVAHACADCATYRELKSGAGAGRAVLTDV